MLAWAVPGLDGRVAGCAPPDRVILRPALSPPQSSVLCGRIRRIVFRHPGYSDEASVLLSLQAPDDPAGGLHHETARLACAIVAGNRWDGFLSESRDPTVTPTSIQPDGILRAPEYYFHLPNVPLDPPYPVCPRFSDWRFPHHRLPPSWAALSVDVDLVPLRSQLSAAISARDGTCRISAHGEGVELAHLVPRSEDEWFHRNGMGQYISDPSCAAASAIDDPANILLLRADIHYIFDRRRFVLVPRPHAVDDSSVPAVHVLAPSPELVALYHNVPLQPLRGVAAEFLFARFAWSIFPYLQTFLSARADRRLVVPDVPNARLFTAAECTKLVYPEPRSRSASPKKRSRPTTRDDDADDGGSSQAKRMRCDASPNHRYHTSPASAPSLATDAAATTKSFCSQDSLKEVVEKRLQEERERSDPDGRWLEEVEWAEGAMSRPLDSDEVLRCTGISYTFSTLKK
ncbi:hypothetical protein UCRNP2_5350 [Neofusicoccum parvum UCRNP2]|uniref:HNH nuclease domain-containing protein n=1 Tax=Botryosphaeria parva (strain UCR-NP2) TaxID=1287680 RepID=R1EJE2_BOTPV|nr:hypothetical protein UCRNP2_5350 [Neofusicoccum parvum UCRNP2]